MAKGDFEVHVGFPRDLDNLAHEIEPNNDGVWRKKVAMDSVRPSHCLSDPHSVPGSLGLLLTQHVSSIGEAILLADSVLRSCSSSRNVRVEVEEVLFVRTGGSNNEIGRAVAFDPDQDCLQHGQIVLDTPPFEIHFGIRMSDNSRLPLTTQAVFDLAVDAGVPVDEAVRFSEQDRETEKVILTTFIDTWDDLAFRTLEYGNRLQDAIEQQKIPLKMKLVAERIILCASPAGRSHLRLV